MNNTKEFLSVGRRGLVLVVMAGLAFSAPKLLSGHGGQHGGIRCVFNVPRYLAGGINAVHSDLGEPTYLGLRSHNQTRKGESWERGELLMNVEFQPKSGKIDRVFVCAACDPHDKGFLQSLKEIASVEKEDVHYAVLPVESSATGLYEGIEIVPK